MKKLAILLTFTASMALAQMPVAATWFSPDTHPALVNLQPPIPLPSVLSVYLHPAAEVSNVRIQPEGSDAVEVPVSELTGVGDGWYVYQVSGLTSPPSVAHIWILTWSGQVTTPVVARVDLPLMPPIDGRPNGDWVEYAGAEVHTAKPGQQIFLWHLTGETPPQMQVSVDDAPVEFQHGGTFTKVHEMKGGESVRLAEVR